jgi:hypothetical protein
MGRLSAHNAIPPPGQLIFLFLFRSDRNALYFAEEHATDEYG